MSFLNGVILEDTLSKDTLSAFYNTGADRCRSYSLSLWGTFPRKALGVLFFSEQMHEAEHGLVGRYGAQTSLAACDRRAKQL